MLLQTPAETGVTAGAVGAGGKRSGVIRMRIRRAALRCHPSAIYCAPLISCIRMLISAIGDNYADTDE